MDKATVMQKSMNLENLEKRTYGTYRRDGLVDILLGSFLSQMAIAPLLSSSLGDFWSSAVFLPVWGFLFLVARHVRLHVTIPRLGRVKYGEKRKKKLKTFTVFMLVMNLLALGGGIFAFLSYRAGALPLVFLGIIMVVGFSTAAYFLDFPRLFVYGVLAGISPIVGEWLYRNMGASHHGLPITFGFTSLLMILVGLSLFVRFVRSTPLQQGGEGEAMP